MLLRFYKSSYLPQLITLILLGFLFWAKPIFHPDATWYASAANPAFNLLNFYILKFPVSGPILSFLVLSGQALFLSYILTRHELIPKDNLLPALIMIILGSIHPDLMVFHPGTLASLLVLVALNKLIRCYGKTDIARDILSASFYISLASLFYFQAIFLILLVWITLIIFSVSSARDWTIPMIGISIPYIYLYSYYFLFDNNIPGLENYLEMIRNPWSIQLSPVLSDYFIWGLTGTLLILSVLFFFNHIREKNIIVRKKMAVLFWLMLFTIVLLFRSEENIWNSISLFLPAISIIISFYLAWVKKSRIVEILLWMLILLILTKQYIL